AAAALLAEYSAPVMSAANAAALRRGGWFVLHDPLRGDAGAEPKRAFVWYSADDSEDGVLGALYWGANEDARRDSKAVQGRLDLAAVRDVFVGSAGWTCLGGPVPPFPSSRALSLLTGSTPSKQALHLEAPDD